MCSSWIFCAALAWLLVASPTPLTGAEKLAGELERLDGHRVSITPDGYVIEDIAGEGKPVVGVIERRGDHLVLTDRGGVSHRLTGVLARPRIAGPGYKVWALGPITGRPPDLVLTPRRLGVLAPPRRGAPPAVSR
ncbi:MAG: hypothetical protein MJE77_09425 [Proteobacteria bacterium]|nr:hypothetical protein [Pseudomonadota bacterium]